MTMIKCHTCLMDRGTCKSLCMEIEDVSILRQKDIRSTDSRKGRYCTANRCSHNSTGSKCDIDICPFGRIGEESVTNTKYNMNDTIIKLDKLKFIFKNGSERIFENIDNIMFMEDGIDISITHESRGVIRNTILKANSIHKITLIK